MSWNKSNKSLHICIPCTSHVLASLPSVSVAPNPFSERDTIYSARALRQFYMDDTEAIIILRPLPGLPQSLKSKSHLTRMGSENAAGILEQNVEHLASLIRNF